MNCNCYVLGSKITKGKKKKSRQILLKEKIARSERYRRIKEDPNKYAIVKAKKREAYLKRKSEKKIRSINELSPRDQKIQRKKWRQNSQRYQNRKKIRKLQKVLVQNFKTDEDDFNK